MTPVLLDTGAIVALLDKSEAYHEHCVSAIDRLEAPLVTCEAVVVESCYLLRLFPEAVSAILENVANAVFQMPFPLSRTAQEVSRIMKKYRDVSADLADASLIYIADQLGTGEILTLDHDFEIYRWGRNKPFRFLIPLR